MTDDLSRVLREAEEAARGRGIDLAQALADRVGLKAGAHAVFGQPVEREGITVIPVAKVRWGYGCGTEKSRLGDSGGIGRVMPSGGCHRLSPNASITWVMFSMSSL